MNAGAIDIGGTKIAVGIVDAEGRILAQSETPTAPELGYHAALERTTTALRKLLERHTIAGIGVGSAGPIDPVTGVYGEVGTLPGWQGSTLAADLERLFEVGIAVENDADAAALGEAVWGAGRGQKIQSLIYVTISTGIGAGMILDGRLYRGAGGAHPELGHHLLEAGANVPACYCGLTGCWESLASGPAMEAWIKERSNKALTAAQICELARQGDPLYVQAIEREVRYLGLGLANLVTMFCPQIIVLGGGMMRSADLLFAPAIEVVKRTCTQVPWRNTSIVLSASNRLLGAAAVWFHRANSSPQPNRRPVLSAR
jgi:glucokinase